MAGCEAQRLIALSLGKIAISRQQRGGINLHKNLLVASVLHKARTTYMMDNFQTLIANRKAQAEREAAAKMVVEAPVADSTEYISTSQIDSNDEQVVPCSRGVTDSNSRVNGVEVSSGDRPDCVVSSSRRDKENTSPKYEISSMDNSSKLECGETINNGSLNNRLCERDTPVVTGKQPLAQHNENIDNEHNQLSACRCSGAKRRRSCLDFSDSVTRAKKARLSEDYDSCESESESEFDSAGTKEYESMQTEPTQVTNLVDIFNHGFSGSYKETDQSSDNNNTGHSGQINVYVSADRPLSGSQFLLKDVSCAKQMQENVSIPTAIALAV